MKRSLAALLCFSLLTSTSALADVKLAAAKFKKISGNTGCANFSGSTWSPAKKVKSKYKKLNAKQASSSLKKECASVSKLSQKLDGLASLPSTSGLTKSNSKRSSRAGPISVATSSGTPPVLTSLGESPESIFWRSGVVDGILSGSPSEGQCGEFFGGSSDGESAGFGACYMAMGVGQSFSEVLRAGTSTCYMKNFPTNENLAAGAVAVVSGALPSGGIEDVFSPPTGASPRYVKISMAEGGAESAAEEGGGAGSSNIMAKIYSQSQNTAAGNRYRYDLVFCSSNDEVEGFESTSVKLNGLFTTTSKDSHFVSKIKAFLVAGSEGVVFDSAQERNADITMYTDESSFKASILLRGDNSISVKDYSIWGSTVRRAYTEAKFSGSNLGSMRFTEGAFKELSNFTGSEELRSGGVEYRDSFYASAPSSDLVNDVSSINLTSGAFFGNAPEVSSSSAPYDCTQAADVVLSLNMGHEAMSDVVNECEGERLDGMDFCRSETLQSAQDSFRDHCSME